MTKKGKIMKMMELQGTVRSVHAHLEILRHPIGGRKDLEFMSISEEEENKILKEMAKEYDIFWGKGKELDKALAFMDTHAGKKFMDEEKKLNNKLFKILDGWISEKVEKANQEQILKDHPTKNQTPH